MVFFIEKRPDNSIVYEAPLNYIGSKAKIVNDIKNLSPEEFETFYDLFAGGFNVGVNYIDHKVIYNDVNFFVKDIIEELYDGDTYEVIRTMKKYIESFSLEKGKADSYIKARDYYNSLPVNKRDPKLLLTIILYGFQQQIRFNGNHAFNNPVGVRWFNDKILEKLISFSRHIKQGEIDFSCKSYLDFEDSIGQNDFVYLDPPYMLTTGAYNDGRRGFNGWNLQQEKELFDFCSRLDKQHIKFLLSYVIEHRGKINEELLDWVKENGFVIVEVGAITGISGSKRKEILVKNYD